MAAKRMQFEFWKSESSGLWYWHLRGKNGRIVAASEGYNSKSACVRTIEVIREGARSAVVQRFEG